MSDKFGGMELDVDQPSRMTIQHPTSGAVLRDRDGGEAWIELHSSDSARAREHDRKAINKRLARRARVAPTAEQAEAATIDRLAALTAGWRLVALDGAPIDVACNEAAAQELYANNRMAWLREQVELFLADRANFTTSSSRS